MLEIGDPVKILTEGKDYFCHGTVASRVMVPWRWEYEVQFWDMSGKLRKEVYTDSQLCVTGKSRPRISHVPCTFWGEGF